MPSCHMGGTALCDYVLGHVYMIGGVGTTLTFSNCVERYEVDNNRWDVFPNLIHARADASAQIFNIENQK